MATQKKAAEPKTAEELRREAQELLESVQAQVEQTLSMADDLEVAGIREAIDECIDALEQVEVELDEAEDAVARLQEQHAEKTKELDTLQARLIALRPEEAPPGAPADESLEDANGSESKGHRVGRWCREFARGAFGK